MVEDKGIRFRIRPVSEDSPPPEPSPPLPDDTSSPQPPEQPVAPPPAAAGEPTHGPVSADDPALAHSASLFRDAQSALAYLGAVAAAGLAAEASARRGPDSHYWIEVPVSWRSAAAMADGAGGYSYAGSGTRWVRVPSSGQPPRPPHDVVDAPDDAILLTEIDGGSERLPLAEWPSVQLADLVAAARLRLANPHHLERCWCVAPGTLARAILRRAVNLGLKVHLAPAERRPLSAGSHSTVAAVGTEAFDQGDSISATWLGISWDQDTPPTAFLHSLLRLPYTQVVRATGSAQSGLDQDGAQTELAPQAPPLLVDIRHRAPLSSALVAPLIPKGEHWLLGARDCGHWRVRLLGEPIEAAELIAAPAPPVTAGNTVPARIPVGTGEVGDEQPRPALPLRLVMARGPHRQPDAVLLDDGELDWLATWLMGRPAAESAFIAPGPRLHLLLAPGGLLAGVPFGLPLTLIGPGGLYLQQGLAFSPMLPETARAALFPTEADDSLIAVTADVSRDAAGASGNGCVLRITRFALDEVEPVWTLWAPEIPPVATGVEGEPARRLRALAETLAPKEKTKAKAKRRSRLPPIRRTEQSDRHQALREAMALERQGRWVEAAQRFESINEPAAAARLYERAASQGGQRRYLG